MAVLSDFSKKELYLKIPPIFTHKNIFSYLSKRQAHRVIAAWREEGRIKKVARGLYAKMEGDRYYIGSRVFNGYISFSSALSVRGLKTELENKIYVGTSQKKKDFSLGAKRFISVGLGKFFFGDKTMERDGFPIRVASYSKILFDMCYRPKYADFYSMYRAMNWKKFSKNDWEELLKYAQMAPLSTVRRIGYVVEGKAPGWVIQKLLELDSGKGVSFLFKSGGNYSKKWRIYDSEYVRRWMDEV